MRRPAPLPRIEADDRAPVVLAMDSSSSVEALAVCRGDLVVAAAVRRRPRGQGSRLATDALALLERAGVAGSPDAIAVGVGPGAFTGMRVALAAAAGLADGWEIPCFGFCSLRIWADAATGGAADPEAVAVAMDARRGEVYGRVFVSGRPMGPAAVLAPGAFWAALVDLPGRIRIVGDGARLHAAEAREVLGVRAMLCRPAGPELGPVSADVAEAVAAGNLPAGPPRPVYLRDHAGGAVEGV